MIVEWGWDRNMQFSKCYGNSIASYAFYEVTLYPHFFDLVTLVQNYFRRGLIG